MHLCGIWPHVLKWGQRRQNAMKKALCSTAAAVLFLFALSGCAETAPVHTEDHLPQPTVEITLGPSTEPTGAIESEAISFSAGNALLAQDGTASKDGENPVKLELSAEPSPTPAPQTAQVPQVTPAPQAIQTPQETPAPQETPPQRRGPSNLTLPHRGRPGKAPAPRPAQPRNPLQPLRHPWKLRRPHRLNPCSTSTTGSPTHRTTLGVWA